MKILPVPLIREADAYTIQHEPIADIDLMERAAAACYHWLEKKLDKTHKIMIFCGPGNNGGDGLAIARMLFRSGFIVEVLLLSDPGKITPSCRINYERLQEIIPDGTRTDHRKSAAGTNASSSIGIINSASAAGSNAGSSMAIIHSAADLPAINSMDVVIDAIFGSGLTRPPEGVSADAIRHINASEAMVVAIDVPSGLYVDETTLTESHPVVIRADYTLTFSPPKLAFFFPENDPFVGDWQLLDIGLSQEYIDAAIVQNFMLIQDQMQQILRKRNKYAHKGNFGHVLLICGSKGKMGAAVLSARSALRSGAGLVTMHIPNQGISIMQTAAPEAMLSIDPDEDKFTAVPDLTAYSSIATGPGIGTDSKTAGVVKVLIQNTSRPLIFDADAINILAENKTWLGFLPKGSIFTPHPKEFERLAGKSSNNFERNRMQRDFSLKYQCYIVLKGAHTAITAPDGRCFFNTTGNPGMATGGSGDVLTGIIAGLFAQGYPSLEACLLGVYLHGLSGDLALKEQGYEALTASDIIDNLGKSFQTLYGKF